VTTPTRHAELAERLRDRVENAGVLDPGLRAACVRIGAGADAEIAAAHRELAATIAESSHRVTDAQVAAVREALGSDRAAFEVIMAASAGAGLRRWDAAMRAIREASDAVG